MANTAKVAKLPTRKNDIPEGAIPLSMIRTHNPIGNKAERILKVGDGFGEPVGVQGLIERIWRMPGDCNYMRVRAVNGETSTMALGGEFIVALQNDWRMKEAEPDALNHNTVPIVDANGKEVKWRR